MEAIRGLRIFRVSKGVKLVPLKEVPDAIAVNAEAKAELSEPARPSAPAEKSLELSSSA